MTTDRQKKAVAFCESVLDTKYQGNLEDFRSVSSFLNDYLDQAKTVAQEAQSSYYSNFDY